MTDSGGPPLADARSSLTEAKVHGQRTISRSEELLPPVWAHSHGSREPVARTRTLSDSRILLVDSSGALRNRLIALVDEAKGVVCVCSFLIADDNIVKALLRAHERGVRVYLLTASESQLLKEPRTDNEYDAERLQDHIKTLGLMAGRVLVRTGEHFHSKFVLADPNEEVAKGFLLTANLTSEALTRNVEIAVELTRSETQDLFKQFLIGFWKESASELLEPGGLSRVEPMEGIAITEPSEILCTAKSIHTLRDAVNRLIEEAKSEIVVSSFGFDLQHETVQKLVAAARGGKKVRIFARPRPNRATMNALIELAQAGAEVHGHPWLHAKCVITDTQRGWSSLIMTANFEARGLDEGFETGVLLGPRDTESLQAYVKDWAEDFPMDLFVGKRVGELEGEVTLWMNEEPRRFSIREKGEIDLGEFQAKKFEDMNGFVPDFSKVAGRGTEICHQQTFKWTVLPPKLQAASQNPKTKT
jgi:phosphatidylserine/phosphatidylglycerophosphate/cardiolipin synthase-like enzyme